MMPKNSFDFAALAALTMTLLCILSCSDNKSNSSTQRADLRKSEPAIPDLALHVDFKTIDSSPPACVPCDNHDKRSIPVGVELFGTVGSNLLEFQFIDHETRLIAYRQRIDTEFQLYYHKADRLENVKNKKLLLEAILAWTRSIKAKDKIDYDEDSFDDYFYDKNPPYVLIRTVSSEQPFTFVVGRKNMLGDYFINVFDGQAFVIDGKLFNLIAHLSQPNPT